MRFWIGALMLGISLYMNYANIVLWNPFYSFIFQESLGILGTAIITRSWIFRRLTKKGGKSR